MKLEEFVCPVCLYFTSSKFQDSLPLLKDVLAHLLCLINEAEEHRRGSWNISELYNTIASQLITLYAPDYSLPDDIRRLKVTIV